MKRAFQKALAWTDATNTTRTYKPLVKKSKKSSKKKFFNLFGPYVYKKFINSVSPRSTKFSPFKLLTGLEMTTPEDSEFKDIPKEEAI